MGTWYNHHEVQWVYFLLTHPVAIIDVLILAEWGGRLGEVVTICIVEIVLPGHTFFDGLLNAFLPAIPWSPQFLCPHQIFQSATAIDARPASLYTSCGRWDRTEKSYFVFWVEVLMVISCEKLQCLHLNGHNLKWWQADMLLPKGRTPKQGLNLCTAIILHMKLSLCQLHRRSGKEQMFCCQHSSAFSKKKPFCIKLCSLPLKWVNSRISRVFFEKPADLSEYECLFSERLQQTAISWSWLSCVSWMILPVTVQFLMKVGVTRKKWMMMLATFYHLCDLKRLLLRRMDDTHLLCSVQKGILQEPNPPSTLLHQGPVSRSSGFLQ